MDCINLSIESVLLAFMIGAFFGGIVIAHLKKNKDRKT